MYGKTRGSGFRSKSQRGRFAGHHVPDGPISEPRYLPLPDTPPPKPDKDGYVTVTAKTLDLRTLAIHVYTEGSPPLWIPRQHVLSYPSVHKTGPLIVDEKALLRARTDPYFKGNPPKKRYPIPGQNDP